MFILIFVILDDIFDLLHNFSIIIVKIIVRVVLKWTFIGVGPKICRVQLLDRPSRCEFWTHLLEICLVNRFDNIGINININIGTNFHIRIILILFFVLDFLILLRLLLAMIMNMDMVMIIVICLVAIVIVFAKGMLW